MFKARRAGDQARDNRQWRQAAEFYEEALRLDDAAFDITMQLGHAYKEIGLYDAAHLQYEKVLAAQPLNDDAFLQMGHLEKIRGRVDIAAQHYRRSVELNSLNDDARREYAALGNASAAQTGEEVANFAGEARARLPAPVALGASRSPGPEGAAPLLGNASLLPRPLTAAGDDLAHQTTNSFLDRVSFIQEQLSTRL